MRRVVSLFLPHLPIERLRRWERPARLQPDSLALALPVDALPVDAFPPNANGPEDPSFAVVRKPFELAEVLAVLARAAMRT